MSKSKRQPPDDQQRFLDRYDPAEFDRPSVTVDVALVAVADGALHVLTVRRDEHPERGSFALPGGFVGMDESLDDAARRVLQQKVGLEKVYLEQLYTFGRPERDPRTRIITVAYYALVDWKRLREALTGGRTTLATIHVPWEAETGGPVELHRDGETLPVAFDHADILGMAIKRLRGKLDYAPIGFQLLPEKFTLLQLQQVHETVFGHSLNKDSFRRRMLASGLLEATGEKEQAVGHRPAELYRFVRRSAV